MEGCERTQIKQDEGLRLKAYKCTEGHLTIGYGHKIPPGSHLTMNSEITVAEAEKLFETQYLKASAQAASFNYNKPEINRILTNMIFQMGIME